ncbi:MAG: hypothetical protein ACI8WB_002045, partial [Phenylobacterium sp.]
WHVLLIQRTHLSPHNGVIVVLKQLHMTYMRLFSVRQCLVMKRNLSTLNSCNHRIGTDEKQLCANHPILVLSHAVPRCQKIHE